MNRYALHGEGVNQQVARVSYGRKTILNLKITFFSIYYLLFEMGYAKYVQKSKFVVSCGVAV